MSTRRRTVAELTALTEAANHRALQAKSPEEVNTFSVIELAVADVDVYERNPRHEPNAKYDELKESIRVRGLESMLWVTKRPGSQRYVLAKGGKTRLEILKELALEDPKKWAKLTFRECPYENEADIIVAHFVENLGRADMCFWDTAKGLMDMRDILEKETGKRVDSREFAVKLKAKGIVDINKNTIQIAEYAVGYLNVLGDWKRYLVGDHVYRTYRPQLTALQELLKLHKGGDNDQFKQLSNSAIEGCVTAGVARGEQYKPEAVVYAVTHAIATSLGYPVAAFERAVRIHVGTPIKSQSVLKSIVEHDPAEAVPGPAGDSQGDLGLDAGADGNAPGAVGSDLPPASDSSPPPPPSSYPRPAHPPGLPTPEEGLRNLSESLSKKKMPSYMGMEGVQVARGLTPRVPKSADAGSAVGKVSGGPLSKEELDDLLSQGEDATARLYFYEVLRKVGELGGVGEFITNAPVSRWLPYGYYMELPHKVVGTDGDDVAVMTWWFLASFAGQLVMDETLDHLCGTNGKEAILEDLGPGCLRHALIDTNIWRSSVLANLVGFPDTSWLTFSILTNRKHVLTEPVYELIEAATGWNEMRKGWNKEEPAP